MEKINSLESLIQALKNEDPRLPRKHGEIDWTSLPTFGGEEPKDSTGVWSWDKDRLLIGVGSDGVGIVPRVNVVDMQHNIVEENVNPYEGLNSMDEDCNLWLVPIKAVPRWQDGTNPRYKWDYTDCPRESLEWIRDRLGRLIGEEED